MFKLSFLHINVPLLPIHNALLCLLCIKEVKRNRTSVSVLGYNIILYCIYLYFITHYVIHITLQHYNNINILLYLS